ncbi:PEP-CTERM sorting domain-containing protein [bacterium]|nr:PEP-CTERM sorting domain-containing protein [bacterium]
MDYKKLCFVLTLLLGLVQSSYGTTVIYDETFDGITGGNPDYTVGQTFGQVTTIKNLFGDTIPISGGSIVEHSGNKMVQLAGTNPDLSVDLGIQIDLSNHHLNSISLDFFFDFNQTTQNALDVPTSLTGELFLLEAGKLTQSLFVLNFNFTGLQSGLIDVTNNSLSNNDPYSLSNFATYTAELSIAESFYVDTFDSVYLIVSVLYPDFADPYDSSVYADNFVINATPVPEPGILALFLTGMLFLKKRGKKTV